MSLLVLGRAAAAAEALDPIDPVTTDTTAAAPRPPAAAPPDPTPSPLSPPDAPPRSRWIELRVGESFVQRETLTGGGRFDVAAHAVGLAMGWRLSRWLGVDLGPEYERLRTEFLSGQATFTDVSIAANLRALARVWAVELAPYVGSSLHYGWSRGSYVWEDRVRRDMGPGLETWWVYEQRYSFSDDGPGVGVHAGVGIGVHLSPAAFLGLDLRRAVVESHLYDSWNRYHRLRAGLTLRWSL